MNNYLIPCFRFRDFQSIWKEYKVGEIFTVTRGQVLATSKTTTIQSLENPYPVYSSQTKKNGLMGFYKSYLFDTAITWTTDGANAGTVKFREGKFFSTNVNGVLISNNGYANIAVAEALNKVAWKYVSKVGNPKLMNNVMSEIKLWLPETIEEQNEISSFLRDIDDTIDLHQQELDALKQTKQGFLQKMFPKEGKNTPEIRFKGFKEEWKEVLLGKITESYSGGTPSAGNKMYYNGIIPFIRSAEINSFTTELFLTEEGLKNSSAKLVDKGTILYAMYGATSGEVGISKIKGAINQAILAIQTKEEYDSQYVYQYLKKSKKSIVNSYLQGGQGNLSGAIIKKIPIWVPSNKIESKKIGEFFKQLDEVIDLKEEEIEVLKKTKQGFLQKMFV